MRFSTSVARALVQCLKQLLKDPLCKGVMLYDGSQNPIGIPDLHLVSEIRILGTQQLDLPLQGCDCRLMSVLLSQIKTIKSVHCFVFWSSYARVPPT